MHSPPCARCLRLGIDCTVEQYYKRVNQRERVKQLEDHVEQLRKLLTKQNETPEEIPVVRTEDARRSNVEALDTVSRVHDEPSKTRRGTGTPIGSGQLMSIEEEPLIATRPGYAIGAVRLSEDQANSLLACFFQQYHPILPFLDSSRTAAEYHRTSRLLFWSIIAISARHYLTDPKLLAKLTPALTELIWKAISSSPVSLAQVQALILNSAWPAPNYRFWTDKSSVYANIALTYATHLGLHTPGYEQEYSKDRVYSSAGHSLERSKTWIACVIVSQSLSLELGVLPSVPSKDLDSSLSNGAELSFDIPTELQHNFIIQKCCNTATRTLFKSNGSSLVQKPTESFYLEMDAIEEKFKSLHQLLYKDLSFMSSLRLHFALLYFQSMYFVVDDSPDDRGDDGSRRTEGILRAYQTATSIITTTISHDSAHEKLLYAPATTSRMIFYAALIIFRVLHSNYAPTNTSAAVTPPSGRLLDRDTGNLLYNSACLAIRRCSIQRLDKDFPTRMADMLKELWRAGEKDDELRNEEPTCKVKSRLGASLIFDCLKLWRDYKDSNYNSTQLSAQPESGNVGSDRCGVQQRQQLQLQLDSQLLPQTSSQEAPLAETADDFDLSVQSGLFGGNGSWGTVLDSDVDLFEGFDQNATEDWGFYGLI
ncbi:conserved hypothetical protein [Talaromyces stipitatus ATCC 10500]|uniref:Transcription factor domain-containing protein n=1 Tax=Talaromyces stipitatus (strain ATCC 10500 / CBS 375.48 / QM 6759 / NRRL 1006) TaxID=441959 RepID=B8MFZ9_TALSN|nr:uncharacterized protein TSTA_009840 [Talaromyces stipitatus ATCC 10500]EED15866.1 conserved hypothetical protein [Talaromyces stipitatus ATCC 10500]